MNLEEALKLRDDKHQAEVRKWLYYGKYKAKFPPALHTAQKREDALF
jgi:hypothetical protein